jgi:GntR family carbon starvation induced transcriptional regulator
MEQVALKTVTAGSTLATKIADTLREQITLGQVLPGKKLRLDELRTMFGVSLSPLREALSRLSAEGFIVMENRSGYRVAPVSESNLLEVTRLRLTLESFALAESIRLADMQWESELVAVLYRLEKLGKSELSEAQLEAWEVCHRELHHKLLSACGMPLLLQFLSVLHSLNDRYRRLFLKVNPIDRNIADEHAGICEAALERDSEKACALLRLHIERTGANVASSLPKR